MKSTWTRQDQEAALEQGWGLFESENGLDIERNDEAAIFESDRAAHRKVQRLAAFRNPLALRALAAISQDVNIPAL